jgi:hypothetical protein
MASIQQYLLWHTSYCHPNDALWYTSDLYNLFKLCPLFSGLIRLFLSDHITCKSRHSKWNRIPRSIFSALYLVVYRFKNNRWSIIISASTWPMLSGSPVTMAWHVLRLQMEETASRNGGYLRIYWIRGCGQPTGDGSTALGLGWGLTTPTIKPLICYEPYHRALDQDGFFGTTQAPKNGYEIWHLEC